MCWQHTYLPLFCTVSVTQLGLCEPWAALNTQQGLQPLLQSLFIFLIFFGCLEEEYLHFMWESKWNAWSSAEGWAMSQLRD